MVAGRVVAFELGLIRHPHVTPESSKVTTKRIISPHSALLSDIQWNIDPDRQVQGGERVWVEEPDEIHNQNVSRRQRFRHPQLSSCPVEAPKYTGTLIPERRKDLGDEPLPLHPIPVA